MNSILEIAQILKSVKSTVIFTHKRADGDTIGSALALSRAFSLLNIPNEVVNEAPLPERFHFLKGADRVKQNVTMTDAEAYICVDCSDEVRLGELAGAYLDGARKKITVNVDHHISNTKFARYNFVRDCAANCENMAELIEAMGVPFDEEISMALLTGLITDSGSFAHGDVTESTFLAAARAVKCGAKVDEINLHLFRNQKRSRADLYAEAIGKIRYLLGDRLAIAVVSQEMLKKYNGDSDMTEGIVDFALSVDTVEVSVSLMEMGKRLYKVSFRSKRVDVNAVARVYGGGGHILASGCMISGDLEEVVDRLRYTVSQYLED